MIRSKDAVNITTKTPTYSVKRMAISVHLGNFYMLVISSRVHFVVILGLCVKAAQIPI